MKKIVLFVLCFFLCILICSCTKNDEFYEINDSKIILHRGLSCIGLSETAPENTIPAFEKAASTTCFGIETDVQETKDGEYVCFHDIDMKYRTNTTGYIQDYTYEELQDFNITYGANIKSYNALKIPLLEDFLKICKENDKRPFLDIKNIRNYENFYLLINKYFEEKEFYIGCSEVGCYESMKVFTKKCICGLDFDSNNYKEVYEKSKDDSNVLYCFNKNSNVTKDIIDFFKDNDCKLSTYIVNTREEYNQYVNKYDIDYIFTDRLL